jgi:hypothetical protein
MVLTFCFNGLGQDSEAQLPGLDNPVYYSATDSIVADIPNQIIKLYGKANVTYDDVILDASIIEIDIDNNEVSAYYSLDSLGQPFGKPVFIQGGEEIKCESLKYNLNTKKGYITEVRTQQGDGYIHMAESKIHPNEEIHFKNGKYTSCDKEKPHYHFQLSKAIVVPEKRIVTGPMHMRILGVPTPLAAPFAFLPNSETRKHGIIIPEFALAGQFGSGLKDFGYYIPINDNWETYFYATGYTDQSWGFSNTTNYYKRYKYRGSLTAKIEQINGFFYENKKSNNYTLKWKHNQDVKAHPSLKFNSDINFISNNPKNTLDVIGEDYFNSQLNSSVNLTKAWKMSKLSGSWTLKSSLRQNKTAETYTLDLPSFNLTVGRFDLGVLRKQKIGKKWYENINVNYTLNSANNINAPDSIFNFEQKNLINDYTKNGVKQNVVIQTNLKPKSGWFNFNLGTNYTEIWNFQSFNKNWNTTEFKVDTTLINGLKTTRSVNFNGGLTSNLYGYYKSPGENLKARHHMSPGVSFSYRPDIGAHQFYTDSSFTDQYYSPFDVSLYKEVARGESGLISMSLGNTFSIKSRDRSDTLSKTFKEIKLIDQLKINTSYDIFKDSMNLSDFTFSLTSSVIKNMTINSALRINPYSWTEDGDDKTVYAWEENRGIGRVKTGNVALSYRFSSQTKKDTTTKRFNVPWSANLTYNINYSRNQTGIIQKDTFKLLQTIRWAGKFDFGTKWKLEYGFNYNLQDFNTITPMVGLNAWSVGLWRDLHCWEARLNWSQTGAGLWGPNPDTGKLSWKRPIYVMTLRVNIKSSMFDAFLPEQNLRVPKALWREF